MKKQIILFITFLFVCTPTKNLLSILDGRTSPIFLDTRYTFTNFEWAKGHVYFKAGFDLPLNGTAILDILDPIDDDIVFRNSTLLLQNNISLGNDSIISGSGFIDAQDHSIKILGTEHRFNDDDQFIFTSPITFMGNGPTLFRPGSSRLSFTPNVTTITFFNMVIVTLTEVNFVTTFTAPERVIFNRVNLILANPLVRIFSESVQLIDNFSIRGNPGYEFFVENRLIMTGRFTEVLVGPQLKFSVSNIESGNTRGSFILDNATLSYIPTGTSQLFFTRTFPSGIDSGRLAIKGQSQLETPSNAELIFPSDSILQLEAGARLSLTPGTKLTIH